jgi:hypothetical protein
MVPRKSCGDAAKVKDRVVKNQRGVVTLDKKLFKRLVESMGQMDEIADGDMTTAEVVAITPYA